MTVTLHASNPINKNGVTNAHAIQLMMDRKVFHFPNEPLRAQEVNGSAVLYSIQFTAARRHACLHILEICINIL